MPTLVELALEMFSGEIVDPGTVPILPPEPEFGPAPENPRAERGIKSKEKRSMLTQIGTFEKKNAKDSGEEYHQLKIALPFAVRGSFLAKKVKEKKSEKAPDFRVYHNGLEVGAIWNQISKDGQTYYKSGRMLCPLFASHELEFTVFQSKDEQKKELHPVFFEIEKDSKPASSNTSAWD
jgi:uncharacterized protein (DUF736 family)